MLDGPEDPVEMGISLALNGEGERTDAHQRMVDLIEALTEWLNTGEFSEFRIAETQMAMREYEDDAGA